MKPAEITELIQCELSQHKRPIQTCLAIDKCLVKPTQKTFQGWNEGETWDLWLVLEERPETKDSYKIAFDEVRKEFGLAVCGRGGRDNFIGYYVSFIETIEAM